MEDTKIVELYWQRSEDAIPETAAKFGPYCHTIAYNILSDTQDTEECVNDTWLGAWNSMPSNRPKVLAPYLAKLTRWLSLIGSFLTVSSSGCCWPAPSVRPISCSFKVTAEMYGLIERLNRERGITVIMISHDIGAALRYPDDYPEPGTEITVVGTFDSYREEIDGNTYIYLVLRNAQMV